MNELEREVERHLVKSIRFLGGEAFKWEAPGTVGVPDRICLLPGGKIYFVELKRDKGRLSPIQEVQKVRFKNLGHQIHVVYGLKGVNDFIERVTNNEI